MNCTDFRERVDELVDGLLPAEEAEPLAAHAADCGECADERERAARFREFLAAEGSEAVESWTARKLTEKVARTAGRGPVTLAHSASPQAPRRRWGRRLAVAAAVLLVAAFAWKWGPTGPALPQLLAEGPAELTDGEHVRTSVGREIFADSPVRLHLGAALFRVETGLDFAVITPRGTANAVGTSFYTEVTSAGAVSVAVHTGRVRFDNGKRSVVIQAGDRLDIGPRGEQYLVSSSDLVELQLDRDLGLMEIAALSGKVQRLEEELATHRDEKTGEAPKPATLPMSDDALDRLPWNDLGVAATILIRTRDRKRSYDPERLKALATFYEHADAIQQATGVSNPQYGLWHPAFLSRMAEPFFEALDPVASPEALAAVTAATQSAAKLTLERMGEDLVPAEVIIERLKLGRAVLLAAREHLGDKSAAEVAAGFRDVAHMSSMSPRTLKEHTVRDYVAYWGKHFDLVDNQRDALEPLVEQYIAATLDTQSAVEQRLGEEEARSILLPSRRRDPRSWPDHRKSEKPKPDPAQVVDDAIRVIDVKLDIARPRVAFERSVRDLLREDQRQRGFGRWWGLRTFRQAE